MLTVSDLVFSYRSTEPPVIDGISHEFVAGAVTAVTGPSGRGKSTLLYLLGLMLTPSGGTVVLDGHPVSRFPDGDRAAVRAGHIGFIFQDAVLDPSRSVLDNVIEGAWYAGMDATTARRRARHLLAETGVEHRFEGRPGEISGGQAQRVALCRALVKDPMVILADEPTGNLDADSAAVVWEILRARAKTGVCVIVATHDRELVAAADERVDL